MGQTNTLGARDTAVSKSHDPCGDFILYGERQSAIRVKLYSIPGEDIVKENLKNRAEINPNSDGLQFQIGGQSGLH